MSKPTRTRTFYVTDRQIGTKVCGRPVESCKHCGKRSIRDGKNLFIHTLVFKGSSGSIDEYMIGAACGSNLPRKIRWKLWRARMTAKVFARLGIRPKRRPGPGDGFPAASTANFNPKNLKESA